MPDRLKMQDPRKQYPGPPFPKQPQPAPGRARQMDPKPDHGEQSYKGSGRLASRKALVTGGDSGIGRTGRLARRILYFAATPSSRREMAKGFDRTGAPVSVPIQRGGALGVGAQHLTGVGNALFADVP